MVLHHVAHDADGVVEGTAALDAEGLGHGDLDAGHVVPVPHGLQQGVGEAVDEQVLDRLLAQVVVDAEDVWLGERLVHSVERFGRGEVTPEGLLDHDAGVPVEPIPRTRCPLAPESRGPLPGFRITRGGFGTRTGCSGRWRRKTGRR